MEYRSLRLTGVEATLLETHLRGCPKCASVLKSVDRTRCLIASDRAQPVPQPGMRMLDIERLGAHRWGGPIIPAAFGRAAVGGLAVCAIIASVAFVTGRSPTVSGTT